MVVVGIVLLLTVLLRVTGRLWEPDGDLGDAPPSSPPVFFPDALLESDEEPELDVLLLVPVPRKYI